MPWGEDGGCLNIIRTGDKKSSWKARGEFAWYFYDEQCQNLDIGKSRDFTLSSVIPD